MASSEKVPPSVMEGRRRGSLRMRSRMPSKPSTPVGLGKPPWQQNIWPSMRAASGMRSKASETAWNTRSPRMAPNSAWHSALNPYLAFMLRVSWLPRSSTNLNGDASLRLNR